MHIHDKIKEIRKDNDTSQKTIADHLNITQQQYSLYENGKRTIPIDLFKMFCLYFGVSADYVLGLPKGLKWLR